MNTSEIWATLGASPTEDISQIREAYLEALPKYHPEDDPAGFIKLRAAYEAALELAAKQGQDGAEGGDADGEDGDTDDPARLAIMELLSDFPRRMDEGEWEGLFETAGGRGIDEQEAFSEKLLIELMGGQYLPQRVWRLLDREFSWTARAKQLKEDFPPRYIEYVLNGMRYERAVRDGFFDFERDAGEDFDGFVNAYHTLAEAIRAGDAEKSAELAEANKGRLFETHPDYRLLAARLCRMREKPDEERAIVEALDAEFPGDPYIRTSAGDILLGDDPAGALDVYLGVLEGAPEHYSARLGVARARFGTGKYEEAKADSYDLLMLDPFDGAAMNVFGVANDALVPIFKERLENDPGDMEARYKLASCYYNLGNYEGSLDLIADEEPDDEHRAKHYELYADLFVLTQGDDLSDEDRAILLEYIEAWETAETDHVRLKFVPEKYHRLGMDDVALSKAEIMLLEFPGDPEICRVMAQVYRSRGDERAAFSALAAGFEHSPGHAGLLSIEALLHEESGNLGAAVDSAETALGNFPYNLEMWELLARVYERADKYEEVMDAVRRAEEYGPLSDNLLLMKAVALYETDDPENESQGLFEDAMEKDPDSAVCLEKLSMIYARSGRAADAAELAGQLVEKHESPYAYLLRGWLYANYPHVSDGFAKARARADFRKAIELDERFAPAWYQLGILAFEEGRMTEALNDFQLTLDISPVFSGAHYYLANSYERSGDFENALRVLDEGMSLARSGEKEDWDERIYSNLLKEKAEMLVEHHEYARYLELEESLLALVEDDDEGAAAERGQLAYALYQRGEDEKAEALFAQALAGFEGLPEEGRISRIARLNRDYAEFVRYAKKDPSAALKYYEKALDAIRVVGQYNTVEHAETLFRALVRMAKAYSAAGQGRKAENMFRTTLAWRLGGRGLSKTLKESRGGQSSACSDFLVGECLYGLKKYTKAKEFLQLADIRAQEGTDCPKRRCFEAVFTLALIALAEGDKEAARRHYRQVLDTVPDRDYREAAALFE